jgi:hypothetical protein
MTQQKREEQAKQLIASLDAEARKSSPNQELVRRGFARLRELVGKDLAARSVSPAVRRLLEQRPRSDAPERERSALNQSGRFRKPNRRPALRQRQ